MTWRLRLRAVLSYHTRRLPRESREILFWQCWDPKTQLRLSWLRSTQARARDQLVSIIGLSVKLALKSRVCRQASWELMS
jgi:hypothetical protein